MLTIEQLSILEKRGFSVSIDGFAKFIYPDEIAKLSLTSDGTCLTIEYKIDYTLGSSNIWTYQLVEIDWPPKIENRAVLLVCSKENAGTKV